MTYKQFLKEWNSVREMRKLEVDQRGRLRVAMIEPLLKLPYKCCPLNAVCAATRGDMFANWEITSIAEALGLDLKLANDIATAADNDGPVLDDKRKAIRKDLLG